MVLEQKIGFRYLEKKPLSRHVIGTTIFFRKTRMKEMTQRDAKVDCLDRVTWRAIGSSRK